MKCFLQFIIPENECRLEIRFCKTQKYEWFSYSSELLVEMTTRQIAPTPYWILPLFQIISVSFPVTPTNT